MPNDTPKADFNTASLHTGKDCLVNYVWVNEKTDTPDRGPECSVSLKHIDCAYRMAENHPDSRVLIWVDKRYLDDRSLSCLDTHQDRFAPRNVTFRDLNDIPQFNSNTLFDPLKETNVWARADLARLIVLDHAIDAEPEPHVFYADFDVPDLRIGVAKDYTAQHGFAFGLHRINTGEDKAKGRTLNNGYYAFTKDNISAKAVLANLLKQTFSFAARNVAGYKPFIECATQAAQQLNLESPECLGVPDVLYAEGYKIPDQHRYREWNWN